MENGEDGGPEHPGKSNIGQSRALRKMMEIIVPMILKIVLGALKPMVISIVQEVIGPVIEVSIRKVCQEEIQKLQETGRTRNDMPNEMTLKLKFLDKVSDTKTGGVLEGINNKCLKLALLDSNGDAVTSGDASSAEVEIHLIDNGNNHEDSMTYENLVRSIIPTGEKKKPHFANRVCISLKNGVGYLTGLKLGSGPYIRACSCRLGAKIAQNLGGIIVQDAWTSPFKVVDYRDALNDKNIPLSLDSKVSRLKGICRNGNPCQRLEDEKIKTLRDFLFWLSVKPEELRKILLGNTRGDTKWDNIVHHALTCNIDDKRMYSGKSSTEPQICVIYDVVGKLKGEIIESHFVPFDNMSADRKDHALKLLRSFLEPAAFEQRYKTFFEDEASLLQHFVPMCSLSEKLLGVADPQDLLAHAHENQRSVKPVDDMNHLQLPLSGGANQMNNADREMVEESSIGPCLSTSLRMEQDFGCSSSPIDHMEIDATWQCDYSEGLDDPLDFIKENFPGLYAESQRVLNSWEQLLLVIKCCLSIRRMRRVSGKRKR